MAPGVGADRVTGGGDLLQDFRVIGRVLADDEEGGLHALIGERLQHGRRGRPRAVVEGEQHFVVAQEVVLLEMLEAEARTAGGVDLDRARNAERIRIVAFGRRTGCAGSAALRKSSAAGKRLR